MLKKTSASIGLAIATAAGIMLSGAPAQAQSSSVFGCCSSHRIRHHSSNWNGNRTRPRIFIRIFIYNKNNNAAVARNGARQRSGQFQRFQRRRDLRRPLGMEDLRGRGILAPVPLTDPVGARSVSQPVNVPPRITQSAPRSDVDPRDNGQTSTNGVVRPTHGGDAQQGSPTAEEVGQNGIQPNLGTNDSNRDIGSWLTPALS